MVEGDSFVMFDITEKVPTSKIEIGNTSSKRVGSTTGNSKYKKILRNIGAVFIIVSFTTFVLLMYMELTVPGLVVTMLIGLFMLGVLLLILYLLSTLTKYFKALSLNVIKMIKFYKPFGNKLYLLTTILLLSIICILMYKQINKIPTMYDCLKLGSDMARRVCIEYYRINK